MTGRAKESIFSILGSTLIDATVLDLYAGSGSLGLEALSRGAADATFVERSPRAAATLERNVEAVGLGGTLIVGDVERVLDRLSGAFGVVFVDPPYADTDEQVAATLSSLGGVLAPDGIVVVHRRIGAGEVAPEFLTCVDERRYGDAVVTMFERTES